MKILCNNCKHFFEVDPEKEGKVQYSKTKSIFRVELLLKSPCPACKTPLKVITNEKKQNIGYAIEPTVSKKVAIEKKPEGIQAQKLTSLPSQKTEATKAKNDLANAETRIVNASDIKKPGKKAEIKLDPRTKEKLHLRLDSYHRYHVQSFKKPEKRKQKQFFIPNVSNIAQHASQPKVYLSVLTLLAVFLVFGMMKSVFQSEETLTVASATKQAPSLEEGLEEFEPTHHDDSVGGPAFPSETDRKTGLEDETIKKIRSNLQILHLPPLRQVTSTYGIRLDPFTKKLAFHAGVDFKADMGTKIEAAMDGVVKYVGKKSMYGNAIVLKHANGYESLYGHLSKSMVKQGQKITQKEIIGLAGSSGRSTGPHLHFELIKNGKKIDPLSADLLTAKKK